MSETHVTVLLNEAVEALNIQADGVYIDGTYGRGGHSRLIMSRLGEHGRLLAFDKDLEAINHARQEYSNDSRFQIHHGSFADMATVTTEMGLLGRINGILLDLGVSSPQLDNAARGFSFMEEGQLDMRMDRSQGLSAAQWLAQVGEKELAQVLKEYGEERFAKRIARAIVERRQVKPIETTADLAAIVAEANPKWEEHKHPATRSFQAIRIFINQELEDIKRVLKDVYSILTEHGRLVVISFHSLEDRLVKRFIKQESSRDDIPADLPIRDSEIERRFRIIGKAVMPSAAEVEANPRSRSAVMRVAERL